MKCKHFLISYSDAGLLSKDEMLSFFKEFGRVSVREFKHKRFKSRNEEADEHVTEYLFHLVTD
jgi:adenine-specific DNA methylase